MSESLVPIQTDRALTAASIVDATALVQKVLESVMKDGVHYGKIPGTPKPTLYQPGAEKLLLTFQLAPEFKVEDISAHDNRAYRVTCTLVGRQSGMIHGSGLGECSSDEDKYRWRAAVCDEEFNETPEARRRKKWVKTSDKKTGAERKFQKVQVRVEPADIANTVLKMAKKRALVDAVRSTTACSDVFEQDLEDLEKVGIELEREAAHPTVEQPKAKPAAAPPKAAPPASAPAPAAPAPAPQAATPQPEAAPVEREPGEDDEPGGIPLAAWDGIREEWHDKGPISGKQMVRLFVIARKSGWSDDDVRAEVRSALSTELEVFPWGKPYDLLVSAFEQNKNPNVIG